MPTRFFPVLLLSLATPYALSCQESGPTPLTAEAADLLSKGRVLLETGQPLEAEELFVRAAARDGDALRTRMWVLRAWIDQGRSDEVLSELDALDRSGAKGAEMDYLYGAAFTRRAEAAVANGQADASTEMVFGDAARLLAPVVEAEGERFPDACVLLAVAAWYAQDLDTARRAADQGVRLLPGGFEGWLARGRVAMSQYMLAEGEQPGGARADELWGDATNSFRRALELHGHPATDGAARSLSRTSAALAHALLWRQKRAEATEAFATAAAWSPETVDYAEMHGLLGSANATGDDGAPVGFRAALESARQAFEARVGTSDTRAATLLWWLGWARFIDADWNGAEEAFTTCIARAPEITNSWFYIGLARQYRKDSEGALAAMHAGWDAHSGTMVAAMQGAGGSLRGFEGLIGWCASQQPARNLEAAFLAEMLAQAFPDEPRHWNNLGLFLRDEGELLEVAAYRKQGPEPEPALLGDLYERSYAAYQRALALTPDDPQILNDTALMLQYHLRRDLEQAEAMYRRSIELSEQRLAASDLSAEERARFEQTRSDALSNLALLLAPAEEEALPATAATGSTRDA
jgi:hypothetical protein